MEREIERQTEGVPRARRSQFQAPVPSSARQRKQAVCCLVPYCLAHTGQQVPCLHTVDQSLSHTHSLAPGPVKRKCPHGGPGDFFPTGLTWELVSTHCVPFANPRSVPGGSECRPPWNGSGLIPQFKNKCSAEMCSGSEAGSN